MWRFRQQRVARVGARQDGGQPQPLGHPGGQILQRMHGEIDPAIQQRFFDFLCEKPFAADLGQAAILDAVAAGSDDDGLDVGFLSQAGSDEMGAQHGRLGERERAAARADFQFCVHS